MTTNERELVNSKLQNRKERKERCRRLCCARCARCAGAACCVLRSACCACVCAACCVICAVPGSSFSPAWSEEERANASSLSKRSESERAPIYCYCCTRYWHVDTMVLSYVHGSVCCCESDCDGACPEEYLPDRAEATSLPWAMDVLPIRCCC